MYQVRLHLVQRHIQMEFQQSMIKFQSSYCLMYCKQNVYQCALYEFQFILPRWTLCALCTQGALSKRPNARILGTNELRRIPQTYKTNTDHPQTFVALVRVIDEESTFRIFVFAVCTTMYWALCCWVAGSSLNIMYEDYLYVLHIMLRIYFIKYWYILMERAHSSTYY